MKAVTQEPSAHPNGVSPLRLSDALLINRQPALTADQTRLELITGFTPLHLETFVKAYARRRFPESDAAVNVGLFGDLVGNLQRAAGRFSQGAIIVIEWSDLDERLGFRASAGWGRHVLSDILQQVNAKLPVLSERISGLAQAMPVAVVAPTLPLPPLTHMPPDEASKFDLQLHGGILGLLNELSSMPGVRIVSEDALDRMSPAADRHDIKMDLYSGFPYTVSHASFIAEMALRCLFPATPKKGLITDLDETLWKGILGDVGVAGVSWSLEDHSQIHALYQQLVSSLAESGVLVAVASKNDPDLVREAFQRRDILLKDAHVFPIEAHWGRKSESVGRILRCWNIGAADVVIVDDSRMELAEVAEKYPDINCLYFPAHDPAAIVQVLHQLRSYFGKREIREEDHLRLQSVRASASAAEEEKGTRASADFLAKLDAKLCVEFSSLPEAGRALELVNKTNQFNLNGQRYNETAWREYFKIPGAFLVTASYEDRFGPLGKIAVLAGRAGSQRVQVDVWVMSCRAFSRQIEFQILQRLYEKFGPCDIDFLFRPTERNGPLQEFFKTFFSEGLPQDGLRLSAELFAQHRPQLFHAVIEQDHG